MTTNVLILGAGFGGMELATRLSGSDSVRITLIDQNDSFVFGFEKLEVMVGRRTTDDVRCYFRDFDKPGVEFRRERITSIDPATKRVETDANNYEPDYLVVALGADYDIEATPGFAEGGHEFYSLEGAERMSRMLPTFDRGSVVIAILKPPFKCPPAPYEGAFLLHEYFVERGVRDAIDMRLITPMPSPIPPSPETSQAIVGGLAERGIAFSAEQRVVHVDPDAKAAELASGERILYDLFIGIPAHRVADVVEASGLTKDGTDGWIHVDPGTLRTPFDGVYAIGDNADAPIPRAGVFALSAAAIVAEDITARIRGDRNGSSYEGDGICYIEFGGGKVGKVDVNFLGGPSPVALFSAPSDAFAREKAAFAAEHRRRWFGMES